LPKNLHFEAISPATISRFFDEQGGKHYIRKEKLWEPDIPPKNGNLVKEDKKES
jgi:hypothetical protein